MPGLNPDVDPDGLLEYSVVYTDRALNHMSRRFQDTLRSVTATLRSTYGAHSALVMPGSGTFGMEAVARQFATDRDCVVIRNGWFSYRWSQIFDAGSIPRSCTVFKARPVGSAPQAAWAPAPLAEVLDHIHQHKPDLLLAPHVETSAGMILPDDHLRELSAAMHAHGGLLVLDCIASGTVWVDMASVGVDVLISAPQKGWSGSPGCAFVMLSERARHRLSETTSSSFAADLKRWMQVCDAYEQGSHMYHATMPTDEIVRVSRVMAEMQEVGFDSLAQAQWDLGRSVRSLLADRGFPSVAAPGFEAPGVVVCHAHDPEIQSGRKFMALGLQTAAGVPLQCDEGPEFRTFRIGLFGLDKLLNIDRTVSTLSGALDRLA